MALSPFHELHKARALTGFASGRNKLVAAYAASNIEAYPYHIAAARFALQRTVDAMRGEVRARDTGLDRAAAISEKDKSEKELRQWEQTLFMENMRLDVALEEEIQRLTDEAQLSAEVKRNF